MGIVEDRWARGNRKGILQVCLTEEQIEIKFTHVDGSVIHRLFSLEQDMKAYVRECAVCSMRLAPHDESTLTVHEFECYKKFPSKIPAIHARKFESLLAWEKRSEAAKRGAQKRKLLRS